MAKTHYKQLINPLYLGAYSLDNGKGGYADIVRTIASIKTEEIVGTDGKKEECPLARFSEGGKPMILNTTNMKMLEKLFKTPYIEDWCGRKIQIGVEPVRAFGETLDALRIRKTLPREQGTPHCSDCNGSIEATEKMSAPQLVAFGQKRYGRALCESCLRKLMETPPAESEKTVGETLTEETARYHRETAAQNATEPVEPTESESGESEFEKLMREGQ